MPRRQNGARLRLWPDPSCAAQTGRGGRSRGRPRGPDWLAVACAAWFVAASAASWADSVVPWQEAGLYAGDVVTVEGDVVRARLEAATCVLEFSDDPNAFRVVLLIPLITDLPHQPQRLYEGKRVRATGTVRRFGGRAEMIVRSPDAIVVVGVASAPSIAGAPPPTTLPPPTTPPPTTPPATVPPPSAPPPPPAPTVAPPPPPPAAVAPPPPPAPTAAPVPAAPVAPPPPPPAAAVAPPPPAPAKEEEEPPRPFERVDPCVQARDRWRQAAAAANARAADLTRCLQGNSYRCRPAVSALAPALSELEWAEQQVESACP